MAVEEGVGNAAVHVYQGGMMLGGDALLVSRPGTRIGE